jgi:MFS family permease
LSLAISQPLPLAESANPRPAVLRRTLSLVTLAWVFGSVWQTATAGAPLTMFATSLHASQFEFGLLSALPFMATLISMPASLLIERTGQRKRIFLWGQYVNRLLWIPIALIPVYMLHRFGRAGYHPAMSVFMLLMFVMYAGGAVGGPAWTSWMADVVPERLRGKYFSRRRQWGIASAIPAALVAGWMLDHLSSGGATPRPMVVMEWCAIIFMWSSVFGFTDIHLFQYIDDPDQPPPKRISLLGVFAEPLRDAQFLWFAGFVATMTFAVSFMGQFVTLYMLEKLRITNTQVQLMLLVAPMIAQLFVLPIWGHAADRMGKKPVLAISSLALVPVGFGWCWCSADRVWLGYLLSAIGAALWVGVEVANLNLTLEMATPGEDGKSKGGSNYVAANSVIINIAGCCGGLSAGVIAQLLGNWYWNPHIPGIRSIGFYEILFALSGILRLVAVILFLPKIHEPAARPTRMTLQFMAANIYNNLFNAVLQPLRSVRVKVQESYPQPD